MRSIFTQLNDKKQVVIEPNDKKDFEDSIQKYHELIIRGKGAIFFAICRGVTICWWLGRASEGIDFSNEKARAVVICGVPYPNARDPRVVLKKALIDSQGGKGEYASYILLSYIYLAIGMRNKLLEPWIKR